MTLLLTLGLPGAAFADNIPDAITAATRSRVTSGAEVESQQAAPAEGDKIDFTAVESTGTIGSNADGALGKTLWRGQRRTQIEALLKILPERIALRSVLSLQRRLLLTRADSTLIENDIPPAQGHDLLLQRIGKLMDMGLYDDAWDLYAQKAENPYDVSIAQSGMQLLVLRNDLPTACLEEKVFSGRYPKDKFFAALDAACTVALGSGAGKPPVFDSQVLNEAYASPSFRMPAAEPQALDALSGLERALIMANGKIRYDGLTPAILAKTPSRILSLYLMDKTLPESARPMIRAETDLRGLSPYLTSLPRDEAYFKAKSLAKDPDDQWAAIDQPLTAARNPADMARYADMIADATPPNLSTGKVIKVLGVLLAANRDLSDFWLGEAKKHLAEKPIIFIYLQAFKSLGTAPAAAVARADLENALKSLKPADALQVITIIHTLDKTDQSADDLFQIYDKQYGLTSSGDYVMPSDDLKALLEKAAGQKQIGITVMAVLNSLYQNPDRLYSGTVNKSLESMLNVGLIEDARVIGSEIVAGDLNRY